ncbi:MAG: PIN domain-containing protein [Thermoanaerobaculia bacterium]
MTTYLLVDTSTWLAVAEDRSLAPVLTDLAQIIDAGHAKLFVPDVITNEFARNRTSILDRAKKQFEKTSNAASTIARLLDETDQNTLQELLDRASKRVAAETEAVAESLRLAERLLSGAIPLTPSAAARSRALTRAIEKKAPFHKGRNSAADALIVECLRDVVQSSAMKATDEAVFITLNKNDFSDPKHELRPHPDYDDLFAGRIRYSLNLAEVLATIEPTKDWSDEIATYARRVAEDSACIAGDAHDFREGAYLRSRYGGLTWQEWCSKCHVIRDTADPWD